MRKDNVLCLHEHCNLHHLNFNFICKSQALAQCEHTLVKLGVAREAVDDTAGAAQVT